MSTSPQPRGWALSDRGFYALNALLSTAALGLLAYILLFRRSEAGSLDLRFMPGVNAALNATSAMCLSAGYVAIRRGRRDIHRALMVSALGASALFLAGYVAYHFVHGDTKYGGQGLARTLYLLLLASHVLLSMAVVPLVFATTYFAARGRFETHRKVARVTLPIWLYVSVTGVAIYFLLKGSLNA